jgi:hypothetical protein
MGELITGTFPATLLLVRKEDSHENKNDNPIIECYRGFPGVGNVITGTDLSGLSDLQRSGEKKQPKYQNEINNGLLIHCRMRPDCISGRICRKIGLALQPPLLPLAEGQSAANGNRSPQAWCISLASFFRKNARNTLVIFKNTRTMRSDR